MLNSVSVLSILNLTLIEVAVSYTLRVLLLTVACSEGRVTYPILVRVGMATGADYPFCTPLVCGTFCLQKVLIKF